MFDLILVADWSAAAVPTGAAPRKDAIWICAEEGGVETTEYFRTRAAALEWIDRQLDRGLRTLLTFDFAMGFPAGLAAHLTGRSEALALWDWLAEQIEDGPDNANNRFAVGQAINRSLPGTGPFWGRPAHLDLPDLPPTRAVVDHPLTAMRRAVERLAPTAKPVWQLAYAGAVGSQSLLGCAALARLRQRPDLVVWPQETGFVRPEARIVLAEIYPSLWPPAPAAIRDEGQVVATARALRAAPAEWFSAPAVHPDATRLAVEEGWILGIGPDGPYPAPPAPRVASDCFALPPGVTWTPVETALATLRAASDVATGIERVDVSEATGRILAEDIAARRANPPEANAAVDGWGFAHGTLSEGRVPIVEGRAAAGQPYPGVVPPGHAIRILTGAALPAGVDTVALQEDAEAGDDGLSLAAVPKAGANTRAAGEDVRVGGPVLAQGTILRPGDVGFAIAAGHGTLQVRTRLRVGVLSTGDEIVAPGAEGGIPDVNRPMLLAMLAGWGFAAVDLGHAPDDAETLATMLGGAATDAILTSGGASAGDEDHLSRLLRTRGSLHHWRIAVKPGRPLALGLWQGVPVFGLPGNPVAAFTCAAWFARPALLQMAGAGWREPVGLMVPAAFAKRKKAGRRELLRARLRDGAAEAFRSEGSGLVSGLSWAEGFVDLPDEAARVEAGDPVRYVSFAELGIG
ncbi:molybdopterin-binding protein [uncultured Jannaschia sp.]|uniref:molybdopterin-binding protein n=1 Tax=uncultured Jannaschia sp. TaxID=293347 RepID=UPI002639FECC|nr:molybdopterin-binding protein [uncultured Jannaschia sp.]